jgi:hypothetical protein
MRNTDEFWRTRERSFHRQHLSGIFVCYAPARTTSRGATQKKPGAVSGRDFGVLPDNAYL